MGAAHVKKDGIRELLSRNLRALLAEAQLSENALAQKSGVSQRHVNNVTRQVGGCGVDALSAMADALGVPAWQMLVPGMGAIYDEGRRLETIVQAFASADSSARAEIYACARKALGR